MKLDFHRERPIFIYIYIYIRIRVKHDTGNDINKWKLAHKKLVARGSFHKFHME